MNLPETSERRAGPGFMLILALLAAGIVAVGYFSYRNYERHFRTGVERQLSAIAELKASELTQYRKERLGAGNLLFGNASISTLVRRFLEKPADADAQHQLQVWIDKYHEYDNYDVVCLLDAQGVTHLSSPAGLPPVSSVVLQRIPEILRLGRVTFSDFHRNEHDQRVYLNVLAPILDEQDARRPLGVFYLRIDPETYLYPFIKRWPTPSLTAETLLVRREGNEAVFLNELRFQTNTALILRAPLDRKEQPAVMAALGIEGLVEGRDYRGVPVLAAVRVIPESPWCLIAKMDTAEVFGPLRERRWLTILLTGVLLLGAGTGLRLLWRQQRVRSYRERMEAEEALRESETHYRSLFENMLNGFAYGRMLPEQGRPPDFVYLAVNGAFAKLTGLKDVVGKKVSEAIPGIGETDPGLLEIFGRVARTGVPERFETQVEALKMWFDIAVYRPRPDHFVAVFDVITERKQTEEQARQSFAEVSESRRVLLSVIEDQKRAEEEIRQLNAELEQRVLDRTAQLEATNKELEAFSYSVSHDLRTPLRGIDGWAQALLADFGDKLGEAGRQLLHRQRAASQRMGTLIDDLLQLSRLTRQPLTRQTVSPAALVGRVWEELRPAQPPQSAELVVGTLPDCQADSSLLPQVFVNLLGNALKFSGGHAHPRIEVDSQTGPDHECVYFVKDNGAGFDMRYASKLFGAFQRLHSVHEFPGTGIGLAIVQRIIRRHGGRIWAESAVGQGATFFFTLQGVEKVQRFSGSTVEEHEN